MSTFSTISSTSPQLANTICQLSSTISTRFTRQYSTFVAKQGQNGFAFATSGSQFHKINHLKSKYPSLLPSTRLSHAKFTPTPITTNSAQFHSKPIPTNFRSRPLAFTATTPARNMPVPPSFTPRPLPMTPRGYTVQPTVLQNQPGINVNVSMPGGAGRGPMLGGGLMGGGGIGRPRGLFGSVFFSVTVLLITWTIFDALSGSSAGGGLGGDILGRKHKQAITGDIPDRISDVIGVDDVLDQVKELVEFLQNPEKYREMGASIPRGVMLTGPPGTGKTLIARAIAGEAGVNFLWCSAADFDEIYVGTGSRRIRDLFQDARAKAPCIIFIDEIDALGKRNQSQNSSRNTINSILVEMDGFQASDNVMVMAATNFSELLDEALVRPGRFDYRLALRAPDFEGRIKLFQHYINKIKHDGKIDCERLATAIMGATGADVKTIVNNAAIRAAARNAKTVSHEDVEEAQEQFVMGVKITTKAIDVAASTRTAYHEAGHALLSLLMPGSEPIFKATILPRGGALGYVAYAGTDRHSITRTELEARLVMAMGGRAAEELIFGEEEVSTGCSSDLEQANKMAESMIKSYGFGGRTGKILIGQGSSGDQISRAALEIEEVINNAYQTAKQLLIENHVEFDRLARALLHYEILTMDEIQKVIKGEDIPHKKSNGVEPVMNVLTPGKYSLFKPNGHSYNVKLNVPMTERPVLNQGSEQVLLDSKIKESELKKAAAAHTKDTEEDDDKVEGGAKVEAVQGESV